MKSFLIILSLIISSGVQAANVAGNAFLDNNSNSENITITFSPVSPGAVFNQINPIVNGAYSTTVENGVYNVIFEQAGYQTYELMEVFLNGNITLDDVTLSSVNVQEISGEITGTLNSNSVYKVVGDIFVPTGEILTIDPGTEIKFDGYYTIYVEGTLIADGNETNYIRFTSNANFPTNKDWGNISFYGNTNSILNYCIIEYGMEENSQNDGLVTVYDGNVTITNNEIRHTEERGIRVYESGAANISNNKIYDCRGGITAGSDNLNSIIIEENEIFNIAQIGIAVSVNVEHAVVRHNKIYNVGIYGIQNWSSIDIYRNIVFNVSDATFSSGIFVVGGQPNVTNNTIFNTRHGIGIYDSDFFEPNPKINSNIIAYNSGYAIHSEGDPQPQFVAYNLFYNNAMGIGNNNLPAGVGVIATTNNNGIDSDVYYNIFSNPELESLDPTNPLFCYPTATSDAVDAADPSIPVVDGHADIGAVELGGLLAIGNQQLVSIAVYPNPAGHFVNFTAPTNVQFDQIDFIDLQGRSIFKQKLNIPVSNFQLSIAENLSPGVYIYTVSNAGKIISKGRLLKN
ncbi:right-handed parallel beta-helix repeat-containing protein [Aequorivita sp. F47161]|uniref:Right-handed parallel beta-helix repeat-containing protein n=1 Tax=Aequorivita vitellina TaxID=2874475 RepID=A0A9X1QWF4_9FLAO|nr:right-handed parallel beta-helix repeat-containing protein [Aequorivita vitellina]MCG2418363.1 right-handed parallel beta-helix repeat-containing protein [Aequorivita vitellina]